MNLKFVVKVVSEMKKSIGKPLTILQISKDSGLSYNAANRTVHSLVSEGIINLVKVGSASVVELADNEKTKGFIALAESYSYEKKR